jgi:hypothetical protein
MPRSFYYIYRIEIMDARYALFFALFIYFSFVLIQPRDEACNVMLYTAMWTHVSIINAARTIFNYFRIFARASWLLGQDDVQKMLMSLTSSFVGVLGRFSSPSSLQGMVVSHNNGLYSTSNCNRPRTPAISGTSMGFGFGSHMHCRSCRKPNMVKP